MTSLQYLKDIYEAARSHKNFDAVNAQEISDLHGVCFHHVKNDIIAKRYWIEETEKSRKAYLKMSLTN